jgi:hypothetical protein
MIRKYKFFLLNSTSETYFLSLFFRFGCFLVLPCLL